MEITGQNLFPVVRQSKVMAKSTNKVSLLTALHKSKHYITPRWTDNIGHCNKGQSSAEQMKLAQLNKSSPEILSCQLRSETLNPKLATFKTLFR